MYMHYSHFCCEVIVLLHSSAAKDKLGTKIQSGHSLKVMLQQVEITKSSGYLPKLVYLVKDSLFVFPG